MNIVIFLLKPYICTLERTDNVLRVLFEIDDKSRQQFQSTAIFH